MTERTISVSVVINTFNRAQSLMATLDSLPRQNYPHFEVIVVNGPSTDDTMELLQSRRSSIRVGTCSDRNLSVSRNVGVQMARSLWAAVLFPGRKALPAKPGGPICQQPDFSRL